MLTNFETRLNWNENAWLRRVLKLFEGYYFQMEDGRRYRYTMDSSGLHFTGTDAEAAWDDVGRVLETVVKPGGMKSGKAEYLYPYLYPVFRRLGIICGAGKE